MCRSAAALGVRSTVLVLSPNPNPSEVETDGHRVVRCPIDFTVSSARFGFRAIARLRSLATDADVLQFHYPWPFGDLALLSSRVRRPYVVAYHSDIVRQRLLRLAYRPLERRFLARASLLIASSPQYAATSPNLLRHEAKVRVVPLGLDPVTYPSVPSALLESWRERIGGRFLMFHGVLRYYKGLQFLLEAARRTQARIVIVGDGPMGAQLRSLSASLGGNQPVFTGRIPEIDKRALLELCAGIVFPSFLRSEAFGISLMEGALYGKPLISCELGTGTSHINVHGVTGLVVAPADPQALAGAIDVVWNDPHQAAAWGAAARRRFDALFHADRMAAGFRDAWRSALSGGAPAEVPA